MSKQCQCIRQTAAVLLACGAIASVQVVLLAADSIEVHVALTGNDAADGSRAKPVASLIGARDAVRRLRAAGKEGPVRAVVADGTYRFAEPLVLAPEDGGTAESPVRYEAAPGARPVFSGGRAITGFRPAEDGLWVAEVPDVAAGQWYFEQLWVDGRRAQRAMEPDTNWEEIARLPSPPGSRQRARDPNIDPFFFEEVVETDLGGGRFRQTSTVSQEVIDLLTRLSPAQLADVQLSVSHSWSNTRRFISAIDADSRTIITEGIQVLRPWLLWKDLAWGSRGYFHLENLLSALDEPGEWFLARDGKLYYKPRPGEDPASMEFIAPVAEKFLLIQGDPANGKFVEHVTFNGLTFHHTQWLTPPSGTGPGRAATPRTEAAVMLDGAREILFQDCEIAHMGIYGLWFRRGCSHIRVKRCLLRDLGEGGVRIGEESAIRSNIDEQTHHITLDNNIIQSGGRIIPDGVGVWIGQSYDNNVTHNDIGDFYYSAVMVGRTLGFGPSLAKRNHISYNHLHHLGQWRMSDMGGVFTQGVQPGTVVSHNVIHDVYCWGYGGWGLYTDEGSSNILLENNLVYNVSDGGFHQHFGRYNIVRNNILAFSQQEQVRGTAQKKAGDHLSFTFDRNIVYFDQGELFGRNQQWEADVQVDLKNNIYWRAGGKSFGFAGKSWDQWRAIGRDKEGSIIADPKFVDPEKRDFRFASDEVIQQTGFKPFDYSQAGVYGDAPWIALAKATFNSHKENNHVKPR
jgi:parallel beta-helix repeat protein